MYTGSGPWQIEFLLNIWTSSTSCQGFCLWTLRAERYHLPNSCPWNTENEDRSRFECGDVTINVTLLLDLNIVGLPTCARFGRTS